MKKYWLLPFFSLFALSVFGQGHYPLLEAYASGGYQSSDLNWSIAGNQNGTSPNILSEVKWRSVSGPLLHLGVQANIYDKLFIQGEYAKGYVKSGQANDTDYGEDNRRLPSYQADLDADEGNSKKYAVFAGYRIIENNKIWVTFTAGYSGLTQALLLLNHAEDVPGQKNLRSTYNTQWRGPAAGISAEYQLLRRLTVNIATRYTQATYQALADWNLIYAFKHPVSFKQKADGYILEPAITFRYQLSNPVSIFIQGTYTHAETGNGTDQLFLDSGNSQLTRFNGVASNMKSLMIGTRISY
ncbi:MAG: hypothetical protein AAGC65_01960 [Mucilaginibacter sp.]|uniref:hypothetical protein n=1 Tax=Mucilaginibacter sp. TaxID=1882438 RepID=UPI0031A8A901